MRSRSAIYRWCEPLLEEIASWAERRLSVKWDRLQRNLGVAQEKLPWHAKEFLAAKIVESSLIGATLFLLVALMGSYAAGAFLALLTAVCYAGLSLRTVADRAKRRLRLRLPFAVDLIALMMEAGASFQESLRVVVDENSGHPLGEEFGEVLRQIALGRTRAEALRALQKRLNDPDVSELVFAINKGEELSTPLSAILRDQADQMRPKRSQWGEKAAGEAEVQLVFPGMVVMVACLLVVLAPIILPAILPLL